MQKVLVDDILVTTMAIREEVMKYYKGTCVERFVRQSNLSVYAYESLRLPGRRHRYERHEAALKDEKLLYLDGNPFLTLSRKPNTITFHNAVAERSPEFRGVKKNLLKFLRKYLSGVKVQQHSDSRIDGIEADFSSDGRNDAASVKQPKPARHREMAGTNIYGRIIEDFSHRGQIIWNTTPIDMNSMHERVTEILCDN